MFKSVLLGAVVFAVTSALNVFELDNNLIEYEDMPMQGMLPYPYQDNRIQFVEPERYQVGRYEPVKYESVKVPVPKVAVNDVVVAKTGIISWTASSIVSVAASAISFIINNIRALIFGSLSAISLCKFTPICSKLFSIKSLSEVSREFGSFATPERIKRASEFVKEAIKKYRALQHK